MLEQIYSLANELFMVGEVACAILFGSVARGEPMGRKSDIDILVLVDKESVAVERKILDMVEKYERVSVSVRTFEDLKKRPYFAYEVLRDGVILFKKPMPVSKLPFVLPERAAIVYSLKTNHLLQKERVRLNRVLYGGRVYGKLKKGKVKEYEYRGLVDTLGGRILGRGAFLVPSAAEARIDAALKSHDALCSKIHIIEVARE